MGDISGFFDRSEFACKCGCEFNTVDAELLEVLEGVREYFGRPVTITSGCRCPDHNATVGGSTRSQHLFGRAADIHVGDTSPRAVQEYLKSNNPTRLGIGCYNTFTHVDTRSSKARW